MNSYVFSSIFSWKTFALNRFRQLDTLFAQSFRKACARRDVSKRSTFVSASGINFGIINFGENRSDVIVRGPHAIVLGGFSFVSIIFLVCSYANQSSLPTHYLLTCFLHEHFGARGTATTWFVKLKRKISKPGPPIILKARKISPRA